MQLQRYNRTIVSVILTHSTNKNIQFKGGSAMGLITQVCPESGEDVSQRGSNWSWGGEGRVLTRLQDS